MAAPNNSRFGPVLLYIAISFAIGLLFGSMSWAGDASAGTVISGMHNDGRAFPRGSFRDATTSCFTDKHIVHHYDHAYDSLLASMLAYRRSLIPGYPRKPRLSILEIGIASGGGYCGFSRWLDGNVDYWGLEFNGGLLVDHGGHNYMTPAEKAYFLSHLSLVDQCNETSWDMVVPSLGMFDIIIDDACHAAHCQQLTLHRLWNHLKPGGVYIIEDTAFSSTHMFRTEYTRNGLETWHWVSAMVHDMQLAALERYYVRNEWWKKWLVPKEDLSVLRNRSVPFALDIQRLQCDPELCALMKALPGSHWMEEDFDVTRLKARALSRS